MPIGSLVGGFLSQGGNNAAGAASSEAGARAFQNALMTAGANKSLASPYLLSGYAGTNALMKALGLGHLNPFNTDGGPTSTAYGETSLNTSNVQGDRDSARDDFQASPGYQFRLDQGTKALDRSAASKGMLLSGAQTKAVQDYGQNTASGEWGNYINSLAGLSGQGASTTNAVNGVNTSAMNQGNALSNADSLASAGYYRDGANALASGITGGIRSLVSLGAYGGSGGSFGLPGLGRSSAGGGGGIGSGLSGWT